MNEDRPDHSQRLNEIIAEYLEAVEANSAPNREKLLAAHPDLADELQSFFTEHDRMQATTGSQEETTLPPVAPGEAATLPPQNPVEDATLAPASAESNTAQIGTRVRYFGDYELLEEIARGGMGVVYKAKQVSLNRIVALKMILAGQLAGEEDVKRFHAEAEAAANLDHPGIVPIYEIGEHEGQHYFSMGYVEGESLADKIKDGPLPPREAAEYTRKVAEAVAFAHQRGVIHRDLKPGNVLIDRNGETKVTDFGLAKRIEGESDLTATGQILGTPSFMPPEQASGKVDDIAEAADVYSLGAILYALVTGRPPFQADNSLDTLLQVLERDPLSPRQLNPRVPQDLDTICLKCLEKDPQRRYLSSRGVAEEIQRFLNDEPIHARPISPTTRVWRWCKRKPLIASLTFTSVFLLVAGTTVSTLLALLAASSAKDARHQQSLAQQAATVAKEEGARAESAAEEARQELHNSNLLTAELLLKTNEPAAAEEVVWADYLTQPDPNDQRTHWALWELYQRYARQQLLAQSGRIAGSSPDRTLVAVASADNVTIYDTKSLRLLFRLRSPIGNVVQAAFPEQNNLLAVTHEVGREIAVWNLEDPQSAPQLAKPTDSVRVDSPLAKMVLGKEMDTVQANFTLTFGSAGDLCFVKNAIVVSDGIGVYVWNLPDLELRASLVQGSLSPEKMYLKKRVVGVDVDRSWTYFHSDQFEVADLSQEAIDIQMVTNEMNQRLVLPKEKSTSDTTGAATANETARANRFQQVALSGDGHQLATVDHSKRRLVIWDLNNGDLVSENDLSTIPPAAVITGLQFSPDGTKLAVHDSSSIWIFACPSLSSHHRIDVLTEKLLPPIVFSADSSKLFVSESVGGRPSRVGIYGVSVAASVRSMRIGGGCDALARQGPAVRLIGGPQAKLELWENEASTYVPLTKGGMWSALFRGRYSDPVVNADGSVVAIVQESGLQNAIIEIFRLPEGDRAAQIKLPGKRTGGAFALSPDATHVAALTSDGKLHLCSVDSQSVTHSFDTGLYHYGTRAAFSPSGKMLVIYGSAMPETRSDLSKSMPTTILYSVERGERLTSCAKGGIPTFRFTENELALAGGEKITLLTLPDLNLKSVIKITSGQLTSIDYSPDDSLLAAGSAKGTMYLWDVATGTRVRTWNLGEEYVSRIAFSSDSCWLRYSTRKSVRAIDLKFFDQYIAANSVNGLELTLRREFANHGASGASRLIDSLKERHPDLVSAGRKIMEQLSSTQDSSDIDAPKTSSPGKQ